jgi:hypothetical protein
VPGPDGSFDDLLISASDNQAFSGWSSLQVTRLDDMII